MALNITTFYERVLVHSSGHENVVVNIAVIMANFT